MRTKEDRFVLIPFFALSTSFVDVERDVATQNRILAREKKAFYSVTREHGGDQEIIA